jgi:hypothetical protein
MTGEYPSRYWQYTWRFISPAIMFFLFTTSLVKSFMKVPTYFAYDADTVMINVCTLLSILYMHNRRPQMWHHIRSGHCVLHSRSSLPQWYRCRLYGLCASSRFGNSKAIYRRYGTHSLNTYFWMIAGVETVGFNAEYDIHVQSITAEFQSYRRVDSIRIANGRSVDKWNLSDCSDKSKAIDDAARCITPFPGDGATIDIAIDTYPCSLSYCPAQRAL